MNFRKRVLIFCFDKKKARLVNKWLIKQLDNLNIKSDSIFLNRDNNGFNIINQNDYLKINLSNYDFAVSLGGDGTLLYLSALLKTHLIPIVGVNYGDLGFLAWFNQEDLPEVIDDFYKDDIKLDKRMMLRVNVFDDETALYEYDGLNEVSLTKHKLSTPLKIKIYIDDELLTNYKGDGIIVSTPTGSTGYSLSAGGPIICPTLNGIILTPICPHSFTMKPIIIKENHKITIRVENISSAVLTIDGQRGEAISSEYNVVVKKSSYSTLLVRKKSLTFYNLLTQKLNWGQK